MALLTPQQALPSGVAPSFAAVSASDTIAGSNGGPWLYHVKNAGGSADTVTVVVPGTLYGVAIADITGSVPATNGERVFFIPIEVTDPATGLITITHSSTTSVTAALWRW